jgi:hypothetical protein
MRNKTQRNHSKKEFDKNGQEDNLVEISKKSLEFISKNMVESIN